MICATLIFISLYVKFSMNSDEKSRDMVYTCCMSKDLLNSGNHSALWSGRFAQGPSAEAVQFETSIHDDGRMVLDDIRGSIAHAAMLGKAGIIAQEEAKQICEGLKDIEKDFIDGKISVDHDAEDIHSFIEATLTDRIGDSGRKLHTGRSRNDQIALDERLYLRRAVPELQKEIVGLIKTLSDISEMYTGTLISGYTHLQRAQPVTLAHHLCAWAWMLVRDHGRLNDALARIRLSPLGSGALAGSSLPLDRMSVANELGFDGVTQNSIDSVSDRDYCIELCAALSLLMMHLSRFCEELVLWSSAEFGFVELSEQWSTGSSIMPQKKNPDFAELIRGRTGRVYGDLIALLTMMKALPLSYNRDMQEDKRSLFDAYDTAISCVRVFSKMIGTADFDTGRMAKSCDGGHANATDLADYLVRKGMPFRTAHGVAAKAVRLAIKRGCKIEELPIEELRACSELIEDDLPAVLSPRECMRARKTEGGPAPERVKEQIEALRAFCKGAQAKGDEGERRVISAMFVGLRGFTAVSEGLPPAHLARVLNMYFNELVQIITGLGGSVRRFDGDVIEAYFGAPLPMEDHAVRCCIAALRMKKTKAVMNEQLMESGQMKEPLFIRIGINSGDMTIAGTGSVRDMGYNVSGHNLGLASRIQIVNKLYGTSILVSSQTYDMVRDYFTARDMGMVQLLGYDETVRLYELLDEIPEKTRPFTAHLDFELALEDDEDEDNYRQI